MKLSYERRIQQVTDRLEARAGFYGLGRLYLSDVLQAVESLEHEGLPLDSILERGELIAERIRAAEAGASQ